MIKHKFIDLSRLSFGKHTLWMGGSPIALLVMIIGSFVLSIGLQNDTVLAQTAVEYTLNYTVNRNAVPQVPFNDLTLLIDVGSDATDIEATGDSTTIPTLYDQQSGTVLITTSASQLQLKITSSSRDSAFGTVEKAALLHNKQWAWSHGFDDNVNFGPSMDLWEAKGWAGSINLIGELVSDTRDEPWIVDQANAIRRLNKGWSLAGHGWKSDCSDTNIEAIEQVYGLLDTLVSHTDSNRPGYFPTGFAAPCFIADYHPLVLAMRDAGNTTIQFNESGDTYMMVVDPGATSVPTGAYQFKSQLLDYDAPIGRDLRIDFGTFEEVKSAIDWAANNSNASTHIWYNTGGHGNHETSHAPVLNYIYDTYGPGGTDEVWVAPSDHIYSYLLVRDNSQVTLDSIDGGENPPPESDPTATSTSTHTLTPTSTATQTLIPTSTQTPTSTPVSTLNPTSTLPPTLVPTDIFTETPIPTATQTGTGNQGCGELLNGDFESGLASWENSSGSFITPGRIENGISVQSGSVSQRVSAQPGEDFQLALYYKVSGETIDSWFGFGIDYLANSSEISEISYQVTELEDEFVRVDLTGTTPPNTTDISVWMFSMSENTFVLDDLDLSWMSCEPEQIPTPTPTSTVVPTTVPGEPTATPVATGTVAPTATIEATATVDPNPPANEYMIFLPSMIR